jgi:hypothetical protein
MVIIMKTRIRYNDKLLNRLSWFMYIGGITLFPYIILRERYLNGIKYYTDKNLTIINHESIHIEQQKELLIIGFYLWYVIEWIIRLFMKGNAYQNISFERDAYLNQDNSEYLSERKKYSFLKYLRK